MDRGLLKTISTAIVQGIAATQPFEWQSLTLGDRTSGSGTISISNKVKGMAWCDWTVRGLDYAFDLFGRAVGGRSARLC